MFTTFKGGGRHEVLIDSPHHTKGLADLGEALAGDILGLLQKRARALAEASGTRFVFTFKNHGAMGGASILHSHFQILGLPFATGGFEKMLERETAFYQERRSALLDHMIQAEHAQKLRMVEPGEEGAVVYCPWASRFPYLTYIAPWADGKLLYRERARDNRRRRSRVGANLKALQGASSRSAHQRLLPRGGSP